MLVSGTARAEPSFAVRTGDACSKCHAGITGGGMQHRPLGVEVPDLVDGSPVERKSRVSGCVVIGALDRAPLGPTPPASSPQR